MVRAAVLAAFSLLLAGAIVARAVTGADFSFSPSSPRPGEEVTFNATSDATKAQYLWDFDGDDKFDAQGQQVKHTFAAEGTYSVRLVANDTANQTQAEQTKKVTVSEPPPQSDEPPSDEPPKQPNQPSDQPEQPGSKPPVVRVIHDISVPGELTAFDASGSSDPDGGPVVAILWDWNNDGEYDSNTGTIPFASHPFLPGEHVVGVAVVDDEMTLSETDIGFSTTEGGRRFTESREGCQPELRLPKLQLTASCIRRQGNRYEIQGAAMANGIMLVQGSTDAKLIVDPARGRMRSDGEYAGLLLNTPLGNITLFRARIDGSRTWHFPAASASGAGLDPPSGAIKLFTFRAGEGCEPSLDMVCAKLPGGLGITGEIDVYGTRSFEAVIDIHAELPSPFRVTGDARLIASLSTGLRLNSLRIDIPNANLGVFRMEGLHVAYEGPPVDAWEAGARVVLPTTPEAGVAGRVKFAHGALQEAYAELTGLPIPVGPGITLNRLAGGFRTSPLTIEGGLGLSLFGVAGIEGNFLFEDTTPSHFHVDGRFTLLEQQLASARFDYWGNGDVEFAGNFGYRWPRGSSDPALQLEGGVEGWWQSPRWQVEGNVNVKVWIINAGVRVLVNNRWIAGCARVKLFFTFAAYLALRHTDGRLDYGFGCDLRPYEVERLRPRGARAAQAGASSFTLARGLPAAGLELSSETGAPIVTLTSPSGETFDTPREPGRPVRVGRYTAVRTLEDHRLIMRIEHPEGGTWTVTPAADSPEVTRLRTADAVPPPHVTARVLGGGAHGAGRRRLVYRIRPIPGQRVRFLERSSTGMHLLGSATGARGSIRFTPQNARGTSRRIVAVVEQDGRVRKEINVATFRAPGLVRPGRPGRVRVRRRGTRAIVRWRPARRARGYRVLVTASDGRRELLVSSKRRRRVVVRNVLPFERLRIRVQAEQGPALAGPARRARLAARRGHRA